MGVYIGGCADSWVTGYSKPYPLKIKENVVTTVVSYRGDTSRLSAGRGG